MKRLIVMFLCGMLLAATGCQANVAEKGSLKSTEAGRAIAYGEYIYYINGAPVLYMPDDFYHTTSGALCRMKADGSKKEVVLPMITTIFTVDEDMLFFVAMNSGDTFIMGKCKADGTEYQELGSFDSGVFQYTRGGLYFNNSGTLAYMDFEAKHKKTIIPEAFTQYMMDEQYIYYTYTDESDNSYLYCVDAYGKNKKLLLEEAVTLLNAHDGKIYFASDTDSRIYAVDGTTEKQTTILYTEYESWLLDFDNDRVFGAGDASSPGITRTIITTGETVRLTDAYATQMTLGKDYLYFVNCSDNYYLYRMKYDGSDLEKISDQAIYDEQLKEINGYLYFVDEDTLHLYRINADTLQTEDITIEE